MKTKVDTIGIAHITANEAKSKLNLFINVLFDRFNFI